MGTQWTDPQRGLNNSVNSTAEVIRACKDDPKTYLLVPLFLSSAKKKDTPASYLKEDAY